MKRTLLAGIIMLCYLITGAQTDTTGNKQDTVMVGNFIIIKNNKEGDTYNDSIPPRGRDYKIIHLKERREYDDRRSARSSISTNYLIFDLGFANYNDKTDYNATGVKDFIKDDLQKDDLKLRVGKSSNVNLWLFMQRLNVASHVLNLKYGLGLEMYNFRYKNNISYNENPAYIKRDTIDFSKNKLYAGYLTVPFMININPTPHRSNGFNISAGVSAGYRIGSHTKQISDERGKVKNHGDFDLNQWHVAYIAEIGLGPVHLYGSYSINSLFDNSVDQVPYAVGLRFSNW